MQLRRNIFNRLEEDIDKKYITILLGARQVGKTTLLKVIEEICKKRGKKTFFFDLEQPQVLLEFNKTDEEIVEYLLSLEGVIFLDEFHYLKNASKIFKAIFDSGKKIKIFATGSSSIEIHKHLKESLAGRKRIYSIYPLTLYELNQIDFDFEYYVQYGGLPGLIHEKTDLGKKELLVEILKSYILKDIKSLIKEENIRAFNHMMYILAQNQGQIISLYNLSNEINLGIKAVNNYIEILKATYVIYPLLSYSTNQGNELKKSQKIYLYDLGIRNALVEDFSKFDHRSDTGGIMEGAFLNNIYQFLTPEMSIKFWRTRAGDEVDFIFVKNRKPIPIEIKKTMDKAELPKGLKVFLGRYPNTKKAFIVTNKSNSQSFDYKNTEIKIIPFKEAISEILKC